MAESAVFPVRRVLATMAGFVGALLLLNLLPHDPAAEMPPIAAPPRPLPALAGLAREPAPAEVRIFVAGASLTSGYPYQPVPAAAYATLLGRGLQALLPDRPVVCRPAAKPALDSPRLAEVVGELLVWRPSVVAVALGANELAARVFLGRALLPAGPAARLADRVTRGRLPFARLRELLAGGAPGEEETQQRILGGLFRTAPGRPAMGGLPVAAADQICLVERMKEAMAGIDAACRRAGVPLVFLVGACDLAGSWPFSDAGRRGGEEADALVAAWRRGERAGLRAAVEGAAGRYPERADLAFLLALLLDEAGRTSEAHTWREAARDRDGAPMHLTGPLREAILAQAAALGRPALDLNRALAAPGRESPDPGLFLDQAHLTEEGHARLAVYLARELAGLGLVPPLPAGWEERFQAAVADHLAQAVEPSSRRLARANLAWASGNFYLLLGNFRDALPRFTLAFQEGAGDPALEETFALHLLFCATSLGGGNAELALASQAERQARLAELYRRLRAARGAGHLEKLVERLAAGEEP